MERHQHEKSEENDVEKKIEEARLLREERKEGQGGKQAQDSATSPASPSSSPNHDFSFTISLHNTSLTTTTISDKSKPPPSFALDLSPADDIFFHGHLLPLHLLSHLPVSPRSSTTSMDSFTLPVKDNGSFSSSNKSNNTTTTTTNNNNNNSNQESKNDRGSKKGGSKSKSFSIFGLTRGRKGCQVTEKEDNKEKHKRKLRLDVVHVLKRYLRMVQPLTFFRGRREKIGQAYSYSGNLSPRSKRGVVRGRRGEYSAPASMRTSPTNSGLLATSLPPASDSSMEELQAAIQAAIAHCKNSIAKDDKLKC